MPLYTYAWRCVGGPLTGEENARRLEIASEGKCPSCARVLRDLRGQAFNALAIEIEGVCFWWAEDAYTCVRRA